MKNSGRIPKRLASKRRPPSLKAATRTKIQAIIQAALFAERREGRFSFYDYLAAVYNAYRKWKRLSVSKKTARQIARHFRVPWRNGVSPLELLLRRPFQVPERSNTVDGSAHYNLPPLTTFLPTAYRNSSKPTAAWRVVQVSRRKVESGDGGSTTQHQPPHLIGRIIDPLPQGRLTNKTDKPIQSACHKSGGR
jgi:hypothetical protein